MAKAKILQVKCDLEVRMVIRQFDILSFESQMKIFLAKVEIVVDPCDLLAALPSIAENLNEDISKKQVPLQFSDLNPKIHLLKDNRLPSCSLYLHEVITIQPFMGDSLQPIAYQFGSDLGCIY